MSWSTIALIWTLVGAGWILVQLLLNRSITAGEFWCGIFCVVAGPFAILVYGVSYIFYRVRRFLRMRKQ